MDGRRGFLPIGDAALRDALTVGRTETVGRTYRWTDGRTDGWMDGRTDGRTGKAS